jgi:transketolase
MPGLTVVCPGDDWEAAEATQALARAPGASYLRLDRSGAGAADGGGEPFVLGRSRRLREGDDATLIATGGILGVVLSAADRLAAAGIACRVVSMHTVKPLDAAAVIAAARETGAVVTVEEHTVDGGLGGAVAECCLEAGAAPRRFRRVGLRAGFSSIVGSQDYLRGRYGLDVDSVVAAVAASLGAAAGGAAAR